MKQNILPNTFIVGAPKCGTTALFTNITTDPELCGCSQKEPYFFNSKDKIIYDRSLQDYMSLYDHYSNEKIIIEASPSYLYYPSTASCIERILPQKPKIIAILRQPCERAFSQYLGNSSGINGLDKIPFRQALDLEDNRYKNKDTYIVLYKRVGLYYEQVKRMIDTFGKENCLVCLFDEFQKNKKLFYKKIFNFLEVDNRFVPEHTNTVINSARIKTQANKRIIKDIIYSRNILKILMKSLLPPRLKDSIKKVLLDKSTTYEEIDPEIYNELLLYFHDDLKKLEKLIKFDLSDWLLKK
jgi:hypothetical protein